MARSTRKAPVTKRTVIQRINRKLAQNDQALKVTRGRLLRLQLGDYYIVNFKANAVMGKDVDLYRPQAGRTAAAAGNQVMIADKIASKFGIVAACLCAPKQSIGRTFRSEGPRQ